MRDCGLILTTWGWHIESPVQHVFRFHPYWNAAIVAMTELMTLSSAVQHQRLVATTTRQPSCTTKTHAQWQRVLSSLHCYVQCSVFPCMAMTGLKGRISTLHCAFMQNGCASRPCYTARNNSSMEGRHRHCAWIFVVEKSCLAVFCNSSMAAEPLL